MLVRWQELCEFVCVFYRTDAVVFIVQVLIIKQNMLLWMMRQSNFRYGEFCGCG